MKLKGLILSGVLVSGTLLSLLSPSVVTAETMPTGRAGVEIMELTKLAKLPITKTGLGKVDFKTYVDENKFNEDFSSTGMINSKDVAYHKDVNYINLTDTKTNVLDFGSSFDIVKVQKINDKTYVQVSHKGTVIGWINESDMLYVPYATITDVQAVDVNKEFAVVTYAIGASEMPKRLKESTGTQTTIDKNVRVSSLDKVETTQEVSYNNWYLYSDSKVTGWVHQDNLKNIEFSKESLNDEDYKKESKVKSLDETLEVVEEVAEVETIKAVVTSDRLDIYREPVLNSEKLIQYSELNDKEISFTDMTQEIVVNAKTYYSKIALLDSKDEPIASEKDMFVPIENLATKKYAEVKEIVVSKPEDKSTLVKAKSDTIIYSKPLYLKGSDILKETIKSGEYLQVLEKQVVENLSDSVTWYKVSNGTKELGFVKDTDLEFIKAENLTYILKDGDTLDSVLSKFKLSKQDFYFMNLLLTDSDLVTGKEVHVIQKPITYDTKNVTGTASGVKLINEMIPSVQALKDSKLQPSIAFAQAIHESGGGTSKLAVNSNNLFGIKGTYKGKGSSWSTWENYGGANVTINATFRDYPSKVESILDYIDLISQNARYSGAVNAGSPLEAVSAIKSGGYATDPAYVSKVMNTVNTYDLTQFDNVPVVELTE